MVDGIDMKQKWIIVLALVCLLTGCSGAFQIGDLTYDNFEGVVQEDGMYGRFEYAKYNDVTYYFYPEEYNEFQRKENIANIEKVMQMIAATNAALPEDFSIYIGSEMYTQGVYGKAFFNTDFECNLENVIILLQAVYGEYANYGLVYGYANYILDEMSIKTEAFYNTDDRKAFCNSVKEEELSQILDMNLPFFETVYTDEQTANMSKDMACSLVEYVIAEHGVGKVDELLKQSYVLDTTFDNAFCGYVNEWFAHEIGMEFQKEPYMQPIRFERNYEDEKEDYPYIIHTVSIDAYVHKDMEVDWYESGSTGWTDFDYSKMIQYFTLLEEDIIVAKEYLSPWMELETGRMKMKLFMPREETDRYVSMYQGHIDTATIVTLNSGYHEYIHHLVSKYNPDNWMIEGITVYMDIYQRENKGSNISETPQWVHMANVYEHIPAGKENDEEYIKAIKAYKNLSNNRQDKKYDVEAYYERAAYMECIGYPGWGNSGNNGAIGMTYEKMGSLFNYLIKTYGEEAVFRMYQDYSILEKEYHVTYPDLIKAWEEDLISRAE